MLRLRGRAIWPFLSDLSAPVTAILLTLLLPLATPWWMLSGAVLVALVLGKHLYGGLGENLFNPAMVGYATLLVVFPANFTSSTFSGAAFTDRPAFTAASFALGGLFLIVKKIIPWQTPLAMLGAAVIAALALNAAGLPAPGLFPQSLFSGSLALAAFFIVTDPVTGCISPRGRLYFAAGAGLLTVALGRWSSMSDGLPFAILLMNAAVPWLDRTTRPSRSKRVQVQ